MFDQGSVMLPESAEPKFFAQFPGGKRGFCKNHDALHRLIQTMDNGEVRFFAAAIPGGLCKVVLQKTYHVGGPDISALSSDSRRFYAN